jgi:hypothetical protein
MGGTGRDYRGRGGIPTPKHSGRLRGKGANLLEVSHRPARLRFPPLPTQEPSPFPGVLGFFLERSRAPMSASRRLAGDPPRESRIAGSREH